MNAKQKILAITPLSCLVIYLALGFIFQDKAAWRYGALIFLLVPLMPYIIGKKKIILSVTLVISIIYVVGCLIASSLGYKIWHPAWLIFLLIPIIKIVMVPSKEEIVKKVKKGCIEVDCDEED